MTFKELGLADELLDAIKAIGFENATPVQEQVIPPILSGKDMIASAQTGTGKTAAFLLPIIHKIITSPSSDSIKAMVIVPTRELAQQIEQQMVGFSYFTPISCMAVYGGGDGISFSTEKQALVSGADVVICTPGRMIAHLNLGYVNTKGVKFLVLDEADRMLDMGFHDDIMKILSFFPAQRQSLLFSATMPSKIRDLARKILHDPMEISISLSKPPAKIKQGAFIVYETQKNHLVKHLLRGNKYKSVIVFCSTKLSVKQLTRELKRAGLKADEIHSDLEQNDRELVLSQFRNKELNILVATDILSRGIDIEDIELVVNFDVPHDGEDYVHRIGRTARAESEGEAITLVSEKEQGRFSRIEKLLGKPVPKSVLPEQFGEAPEYDPKAKTSNGPNRNFRNKKGSQNRHSANSGRNSTPNS